MITIRKAEIGDEQGIYEIFEQAKKWVGTYRIKTIRKFIRENERGKASLLVAEENGEVIGVLKLKRPSRTLGQIGKIAVRKEHRGKKLGLV